MINRSVPVNGVLPELYYRDADAALPWLERVFGFRENYRVPEDDGRIHTSQMFLGNCYFMLRYSRAGQLSPLDAGGATQSLMVIVDDVDVHFQHAQQEGAKIISSLTDREYGERDYTAHDLEGHPWTFSQHIADIDPKKMFS